MLLDINLIDIGERIREEQGDDFKTLVESVRRFGQLQAIVVRHKGDHTYELVAGERRLRAVTLLHGRGDSIGHEGSTFFCPPLQVRAEIEGEISDQLKLMMEFEENFRRKDFTWDERSKYIRRFHNTFVSGAKESGQEWNQEMTAFALKLDPSSISIYLQLEEMSKNQPEIAKAKTLRGALKRAKAVKAHQVRVETAKRAPVEAGLDKASEVLINGDGIEWLKSIPSESIDLVNLDPPWGDESSYKTKQASWDEFDDSLEYATEIIPLLLTETLRVLKPDRFCIFWYRQWLI